MALLNQLKELFLHIIKTDASTCRVTESRLCQWSSHASSRRSMVLKIQRRLLNIVLNGLSRVGLTLDSRKHKFIK